jgi:hypothetical protein
MIRASRPGWRLLLVPLIPYLLSFLIPFKTHDSIEFGYAILQNKLYSLCRPTLGPKDIGDLMATVSWLANPLVWIGYFAMTRGRYAIAIILGLGATFLALGTPVLTYISGQNVFPEMPYCWWTWLASMVLLIIAAELAYDLSPEREELERQWASDRAKRPRP